MSILLGEDGGSGVKFSIAGNVASAGFTEKAACRPPSTYHVPVDDLVAGVRRGMHKKW